MTPEGAANSTSFKMEGSGSGGGSYAPPYVSRKTTDAAVIDSIVWSATSGGTATVTTHSNDAPPHATAGSDDIASDGRCLADRPLWRFFRPKRKLYNRKPRDIDDPRRASKSAEACISVPSLAIILTMRSVS